MLKIALLLLAVGAAQAERVQYRECYNVDNLRGPLERTIPTNYTLLMVFDMDSAVASGALSITMQVDDSRSKHDEPKKYIALNMEKRVEIESVSVYLETADDDKGSRLLSVYHVCYDPQEQLILIQLWNEIMDKSRIRVSLTIRSPIKFGETGLYQVYDDTNFVVARANFANSQAQQIIPCFDDPDHKTTFDIGLIVEPDLDIRSNSCDIRDKRDEFGRRVIRIREEQPISLHKITLELFKSAEPVPW